MEVDDSASESSSSSDETDSIVSSEDLSGAQPLAPYVPLKRPKEATLRIWSFASGSS